jgi:hypothetical protein
MRKKMLVSLCLVGVALLTLGAADSCKAPIDATGDYSGTWSITVNEGEGEETTPRIVECTDLRMTLEQDVNLDYPDNLKVTGTLFIDDYSCLEEAGWPELIPLPEPGEVAVTGTMSANDKRIILGSGGIGTGAGAIFAIDGYGESNDQTGNDIPEMARYAGNWGLAISIVFIGTGGVGGEFDVARN